MRGLTLGDPVEQVLERLQRRLAHGQDPAATADTERARKRRTARGCLGTLPQARMVDEDEQVAVSRFGEKAYFPTIERRRRETIPDHLARQARPWPAERHDAGNGDAASRHSTADWPRDKKTAGGRDWGNHEIGMHRVAGHQESGIDGEMGTR